MEQILQWSGSSDGVSLQLPLAVTIDLKFIPVALPSKKIYPDRVTDECNYVGMNSFFTPSLRPVLCSPSHLPQSFIGYSSFLQADVRTNTSATDSAVFLHLNMPRFLQAPVSRQSAMFTAQVNRFAVEGVKHTEEDRVFA